MITNLSYNLVEKFFLRSTKKTHRFSSFTSCLSFFVIYLASLMDKSNVSSSLEYFLYKERQIKHMPFKRLLLTMRKYFQKTRFSYTLFKCFFGYIFFCSPLILVVLLFNKTYVIDYGSCNVEAFILPLISSICFLVMLCLSLMIWRIISSIKAK